MGTYTKIAEYLHKAGVCGYFEHNEGKALVKNVAGQFINIGSFGEDVFEVLKNHYGIKKMN
jgi:hypothetical protein